MIKLKILKSVRWLLNKYYWLNDSGFSVNISLQLNDLNLKLPEKDKNVIDFIGIINPFKNNVQLWEETESLTHFLNIWQKGFLKTTMI